MAKKNNLIEEVQELVQQIKTNFQEGVDFEIAYQGKTGKGEIGAIKCLSPRLRKYCREWFNFSVVNDRLDYSKRDQEKNGYYYRIEDDSSKFEGLYWHHHTIKEQEPKKCGFCGELTSEEDGRFWVWSEKQLPKEISEDSKVIAYLHSSCLQKYFADKKQPNKNDNSRIKEKILRNLDKICLDPIGYLANAEIIKGDIEKDYGRGSLDKKWNELQAKIRKVEIEEEEIDLMKLEYEDRQAIRRALIDQIKQNPQDWKIEKSSIYAQPSLNIPDSFRVLRHKSGRRHWNVGIIHLNESWEKGQKDWAEIEALLQKNDFAINKPISDLARSKIEKYFRENDIYAITLEGDNLLITYNNKSQKVLKVDNQQLEAVKSLVQKQGDKSLTREQIINNNDKQTSTGQPNKINYGLWISCGVISVVALGLLFLVQRKKRISRK